MHTSIRPSVRTGRSRCFRLAVVLVAAFSIVGLVPSVADAARPPNWAAYQIQFPPPPASGSEALDTLDERANAVIDFLSCGDDIEFWLRVRHKDSNEDLLGMVIAKVMWVAKHQSSDVCTGSYVLYRGDLFALNGADAGSRFTQADWLDLAHFGIDLSAEMRRAYGAHSGNTNLCADVMQSVVLEDGSERLRFTYRVSHACMKAQLNEALRRMIVVDQLGSSDVPCHGFVNGKTKGEWDVSVRDLVRIVYLNDRHGQEILDWDVNRHVRRDLITVSGPPGQESYSLLQCGNKENHTGSAEDREEERGFLKRTLDSLGDIGLWFLRRLLILAPILFGVPPNPVVAALSPAAAAAVEFVVAAGPDAARVSETENHLLNIETSRYLFNHLLIKELGSGYNGQLLDDQEDCKEWLLEHLRVIVEKDFIEYNSRPYQRYSLRSILNLAEFVDDWDDDVRTAALIVLDYASAKFAVASHAGRRMAPFRRRMSTIADLEPADPNAFTQGAFDQVNAADHMIGFMLLFAGQTQQLPDRKVHRSAAAAMVYEATSEKYRPESIILDLVASPRTSYHRFRHHDAAEIYSRAPGYLISAGGIETGLAYTSTVEVIDKVFASDDDLGAAVPTTLMLVGGTQITALTDYLQLKGPRAEHGDVYTYGHNLCVWRGFACGSNLYIPDHMTGCFERRGPWRFLDTTSCGPYAASGHRVLVALYEEPLPLPADEPRTALFEVVDAPTVTLSAFIDRILDANRAILQCRGIYHSFSGHAISFYCLSDDDDSDKWGIESVDGVDQPELDDPEFRAGENLQIDMPDAVRFRIRDGAAVLIEVDWSDQDHPRRTVH